MFSRYLPFLFLPSLTAAYSFNVDSTPRQCDTLSVSITGTGQPPYSVLIVPFGPSPLPNNTEVRTIVQQNFSGISTSLQLKYPEDSQFVIVMSDQSGFGSGGTTSAVTTLSSSDSSCFNANQGTSPGFVYSLVPNSLQQCAPTRIWWNPAVGVQGSPFFLGAIPGGQSFTVPQSNLTTVPEQGFGFSWTPSVRAGTTVLLIGGDDRGPGSGGSSTYFVNFGDNSCLNSDSPSSTPGSPAGGSYPTSTSGAGTGGGGSSGHHSDVGAIVGGVVGGVVGFIALLLILLFFIRRRRFHKTQKERPVDLLHDQEGDASQDGHPPQYYQPEPFLIPEPTVISSAGAGEGETSSITGGVRPSLDHRVSRYSAMSGDRSSTPDQSAISNTTYLRKSPAPPSFRPVNIIQHDDAGPSGEAEPETIELPPAYTNIRKHDGSHETSPSPSPAETPAALENADESSRPLSTSAVSDS